MQLSGVRLSVRPFRPAAACRFCGFAAVGRAPGRYRSIAARPAGSSSGVRRANAGSATLSAYVVAEHILVFYPCNGRRKHCAKRQ